MFVNPRLGRRRCSGIWPPSKPRFWPNPVPARCPLEPRVAVLPCPEPIPRPMRLRVFVCPAGGFNPLRFIVPELLDAKSLFHDCQRSEEHTSELQSRQYLV